jgi:septal ring factor EnvC (AmiA/AmiB activator)
MIKCKQLVLWRPLRGVSSALIVLALLLSAALPGSLMAQERSAPMVRDSVGVRTTVPARQATPERTDTTASADKARSYLEEAQNNQLSELSANVAALKNENNALRSELASLRADIEAVKAASRPPAGYSAAFTTKRNWDGLEDGVGIRYYAPLAR